MSLRCLPSARLDGRRTRSPWSGTFAGWRTDYFTWVGIVRDFVGVFCGRFYYTFMTILSSSDWDERQSSLTGRSIRERGMTSRAGRIGGGIVDNSPVKSKVWGIYSPSGAAVQYYKSIIQSPSTPAHVIAAFKAIEHLLLPSPSSHAHPPSHPLIE